MLPEPQAAPAIASDEDSWSWLVTFSDLVLQLFGFAVIAALGGAAVHGAAKRVAPAPAASVAQASAPAPAAAPVAVAAVAARAPERAAEPDPDAPPPANSDADDVVPVRPAARAPAPPPAAATAVEASPAPQAPLLRSRMAALGTYVEHLAALEPDLDAKVKTHDDDVVVVVGDAAGFAPGSAEPSRAMLPLLDELRAIVAASPDLQVEISGHTDDVPIRTARFPSNLELSLARASHVAHALVGSEHALWARVSAAGYGEQRPIASNADAAGRAQNRRVEIRLARAG